MVNIKSTVVTVRLSSGGKDKENNVEYLNFQNFPADVETRACFVSEPENSWISCDYSGHFFYDSTKHIFYFYFVS